MNGSRLLLSTALLLVGGPAFAGQAPFAAAAPDFPVSGRDRVYAAEQFSNWYRNHRMPFAPAAAGA